MQCRLLRLHSDYLAVLQQAKRFSCPLNQEARQSVQGKLQSRCRGVPPNQNRPPADSERVRDESVAVLRDPVRMLPVRVLPVRVLLAGKTTD